MFNNTYGFAFIICNGRLAVLPNKMAHGNNNILFGEIYTYANSPRLSGSLLDTE